MEKFKPFIIPVALLVLIDQMVKIVISKVFMKYEFDIIAKVLRFNPEIIYVFLTIFLYLLKCPQSLIL